MLTESASQMFVHCQNTEFGCGWHGLYGDMAQHLEYCSPCKPQQLLNLLEHRTREKAAADMLIDALKEEVQQAEIFIDELTEENRKLKKDIGAASGSSPKRRRQDEQQPPAPCNGER